MPIDDLDTRIQAMPEAKLELLDGRLSVGNGAGNLQLLRHLLEGWGAEAAVPMTSPELWWVGLHQGFREFDPPSPDRPPAVWHAWAAQFSYQANLPPAGPWIHRPHAAARER